MTWRIYLRHIDAKSFENCNQIICVEKLVAGNEVFILNSGITPHKEKLRVNERTSVTDI
jgi:hypothetical protein